MALLLDGGSRSDAAKLADVTPQVVRNWVLRFDAEGPDGLATRKAPGRASILNDQQRARLAEVVETEPVPAAHGVVRWRLADFAQWVSAIAGAGIIREEKWAVEAFGVCASSCMNYWAPATASFSSTPGTVLIVHGRPPRRTTLVRLKRPRIVKLFVMPEDYCQHTDFAGSLNIPEDWFGSTLAAGGKIAKAIGDPRSEALLVGPCHARLIAEIVPVNVWWPSSKRELRDFLDALPTSGKRCLQATWACGRSSSIRDAG